MPGERGRLIQNYVDMAIGRPRFAIEGLGVVGDGPSASVPRRLVHTANMAPVGVYQSAIFSDIDGTLVHYLQPHELAQVSAPLPCLPCSSSCLLSKTADRARSDRPPRCTQVRGTELLMLPASSTGRLGVISKGSLQRVAALRARGAAFALVSGARTSTVLQRLPFLPAADALVAENGE